MTSGPIKLARPLRQSLAIALLILTAGTVDAQTDSLFLSNGNVIVGELKEMTRNVATIKTNYSSSDFKIEWDKVSMVRSTSMYLVQLTHGERYTAHLHSVDSEHVQLVSATDTALTQLVDIVYLKTVKADFWSRASASVDLGYDYTKANNLQQFSLRSTLGYQTDRWMTSATFNKVRSKQDEVDAIQRTDLGANFRWSLPKGFFVALDASFLSNTEQLLDLRSSYQPSIGNYLVRSNSMYLLASLGAAYTHEDYSTDAPTRNSAEGLIGVELNLFDVGDVNFFLSSKVFPSFTETGRWRMDESLNVKYDLPKDLYVRLGLTFNYDNRPVEGATETDYLYQIALGWEL